MPNDRPSTLPPDLADRIEEHARRHGLSYGEAYADLLERGLATSDDGEPLADGGERPTERSSGDQSADRERGRTTADRGDRSPESRSDTAIDGTGSDDRTATTERVDDREGNGEDRRDGDGEGWDVPETFADVAPTRTGRLRWFGTLLVVLGIVVAAGYALLLVLGLSYFGVDPTGGVVIALATAAVGLLLLILGWIGGWLAPYATLFGRRLRIALDPDDG
jgi:hypothetical protein